jgi:hypothetical protein
VRVTSGGLVEPKWTQLGPNGTKKAWAQIWALMGPILLQLDPCCFNLGQMDPKWAQLGPTCPHWVQMQLFWVQLGPDGPKFGPWGSEWPISHRPAE